MAYVIHPTRLTAARGSITLRVVVVERMSVLRTGVVQTLRRLDVSVVSEVATAEDAIATLHTTGADLLLIGANIDVQVSHLVARAKALPACPLDSVGQQTAELHEQRTRENLGAKGSIANHECVCRELGTANPLV